MSRLYFFRSRLAAELRGWVGEGIISREQAGRIAERYGIDPDDAGPHAHGYTLLVILASLFAGLAVLTLVGANWEDIPRALRMGALIALTLAVNLAGLALYRRGRHDAAVATFFLGGLVYGAAIMLIAQVYHLGEHFPDGIYWWAMGTLPFALLTASPALMTLTGILAGTWLSVSTELGYYPTTFPLFLGATAWLMICRRQSSILLGLLVAGVFAWLQYNLAWWLGEARRYDFGPENLTLAVGLVLVALATGAMLENRRTVSWHDPAERLQNWAWLAGVCALLAMSFEFFWEGDPDPAVNTVLTLVMAAIATWMLWLAHASRRKLFLAVGLYTLVFTAHGLWQDQAAETVFQVAANIGLVVAGIWLIQAGLLRHRQGLFNLGISTLLLTALLRYMDLVGNYVGAAVLFFVFALILLGAARYWRATQVGAKPPDARDTP